MEIPVAFGANIASFAVGAVSTERNFFWTGKLKRFVCNTSLG